MNAPPPPYVMLSENQGNVRLPPYRRNAPQYPNQRRRSGGNCCLQCICCCYCFLFILILVCAGAALYFYSVFRPKMPSYDIKSLNVKALDRRDSDTDLNTELNVTVKAKNPNERISFIYGEKGSVTVFYTHYNLCSGELPSFRQGHKNTTVIAITMTGKSKIGSKLQEELMERQSSGRIPLLVMVKAPISIVLGKLPMRQFVVLVNCSLVVNNLLPDKEIKILSSSYKFDFKI